MCAMARRESMGEGAQGLSWRQATTILVAVAKPPICRLLRRALKGVGWRAVEVDSGQLAISQAAVARPDGIVVDLELPDTGAADVIRRVREWTRVPILVLGDRQTPEGVVRILDLGADDFLVEPFNTGEFVARLRALLRRAEMNLGTSEVVLGPFRMDFCARRVEVRGREVRLTPIEYVLLETLVRHCGKVVTHPQILREIWGPDGERYQNPLRVHLAHIRRKLTDAGMPRRWLRTELGIGYRVMG